MRKQVDEFELHETSFVMALFMPWIGNKFAPLQGTEALIRPTQHQLHLRK